MLSILGIVEIRKGDVTTEVLRRRVPPRRDAMLTFVEEAMLAGLMSDPDETVVRLLRPTPE